MTRRALIIGLGLSLLFNAFVLVGFVRARSENRIGNDRQIEHRIARELSLNPNQAKTLSTLRADHREQSAVFDESIALLRQNLMTELRKENPDLETLRDLVEQESQMNRQRRLVGADLFGRFVGELSPQQRRNMVGRFMNERGQMNQRPIPKKILERFDANRNGRLDPEEMRRAQQEMERRRREMGRQGTPPPKSPPPVD